MKEQGATKDGVSSALQPQTELSEGGWKWLRESVINYVCFAHSQNIVLAVQGFLNWIDHGKSEVMAGLCVQRSL